MASIFKVNTIQDATNSNTALTIDSSGEVLHSVKPSFMAIGIRVKLQILHKAQKVRLSMVTPSGNNLIYNYRNIVQNTGNHFSNTSGRFTCPVAGVYLVTSHVGYKDGTNYTGLGMYATTGDSTTLGHIFAWSQNSPNHDCLSLTAHVVASVGQQFCMFSRGDYSHPAGSSSADEPYFSFGATFIG